MMILVTSVVIICVTAEYRQNKEARTGIEMSVYFGSSLSLLRIDLSSPGITVCFLMSSELITDIKSVFFQEDPFLF